jgi:hypothetical protein
MAGQGGSSTWVEQENFNQILNQINQLQIAINDTNYQVGRILSALDKGQTPNALTIDVTNQQILAKDGTLIMSGIANVTSNYNLRIPLIWKDSTGVAIPPASGNTQASSSNLKVVPEVDVADDDLSIVVHVAALGSSFVTVSNGAPLPVSRMVGSTSTMPGRNAICRRSATSTFGRTAFNCRSGSKTRSSAFRC